MACGRLPEKNAQAEGFTTTDRGVATPPKKSSEIALSRRSPAKESWFRAPQEEGERRGEHISYGA